MSTAANEKKIFERGKTGKMLLRVLVVRDKKKRNGKLKETLKIMFSDLQLQCDAWK